MTRRLMCLCPLGVAALTAFAGGCAAPQAPPDAPMPDEFACTLWSRTTDLRVTYFELDADGALRYAGGQQAVYRKAKPVGRLTEAQRQELWRIAATTGLLNAEDQPFAQAHRVQYRFEIKAPPWSREFRTVDEAASGAESFHDALFQVQAKLNDYRVPGL